MKNPVEDGTLVEIELGSDGTQVLAAGPLSRQPGTMPYRIVLLGRANGSYSVHSQMFETLEPVPSGDHFMSGDYFAPGANGLVGATKRFGERVAANAEYLASLWREETVAA